jgi:putative phosphoesterase
MRVLVISDTHGDISGVHKILSDDAGFDLIIHLGDYLRDAEKIEAEYPDIKVEYVYGNCDFRISDIPSEKLIEIKGKRILFTHGHKYSVKYGPDKLIERAREAGADILLYGHTHVSSLMEGEGFVLLNPGSISNSRDSFGESYAVLDFSGPNMTYDILQV